MPPRALIILHPGFEEIEAVTPIDLLTRAGVDVVQAALGSDRLVPARNGVTLQATHRLAEVAEQAFDALLLPGGPGILQIRQHPLICELLRKQQAAGKLIGCICAAPLLLRDAGLTDHLRYTCHPTAEDELTAAICAPVVHDCGIITARGAGTATEFALQLVRHLVDHAAAQKIATSICWPYQL